MSPKTPTAAPTQPAAKPRRRALLAVRPPTMRARATNGGHFLKGIDGRTTQARRIYDITAAVASDLGGADRLSETKIALIRRFAALAVLAEEQEVKIARGEPIDVSAFAHISSTLVRLATRIGVKRVPRDITPTLADYLQQQGEAAR
jgi:hypothetical protein